MLLAPVVEKDLMGSPEAASLFLKDEYTKAWQESGRGDYCPKESEADRG